MANINTFTNAGFLSEANLNLDRVNVSKETKPSGTEVIIHVKKKEPSLGNILERQEKAKFTLEAFGEFLKNKNTKYKTTGNLKDAEFPNWNNIKVGINLKTYKMFPTQIANILIEG